MAVPLSGGGRQLIAEATAGVASQAPFLVLPLASDGFGGLRSVDSLDIGARELLLRAGEEAPDVLDTRHVEGLPYGESKGIDVVLPLVLLGQIAIGAAGSLLASAIEKAVAGRSPRRVRFTLAARSPDGKVLIVEGSAKPDEIGNVLRQAVASGRRCK